MWDYCEVLRNNELLLEGLYNLNIIKELKKDANVSISDNNCEDLILICDLESSIISAEATINSALKRSESRGAHQRGDYPNLDEKQNYNIAVKLNRENNNLEIYTIPSKKLDQNFNNFIKNNNIEEDFKGKLLE